MFSGSVGSISLPDDDDAKALRTEERMAFHVLVGWGDTTPWVRNLGTPMALWLGASCGLSGCEARLGTSGVSLVRSFDSECPVAAPELAWNAWRSASGGGDHTSRWGEEPRDTDGALVGCFVCGLRGCEARLGTSGVSLVRSFDSECPVAAPELA